MIRLNCERAGPRGGPSLVLLHPMGADIRFWDPCRTLWERRHDCLALDLPSAGESPDLPGTSTLQRQAQAVAAEIAAQGIDRFVVIGCAVGAMVAAELAAVAAPLALVMANPGLATRPEAREALARRARAVRDGGLAAVLPDAVDLAFEGQPRGEVYRTYVQRFASQDPERYAKQIDAMLDADTRPALAATSCPTLLVMGGHDRLLTPDLGLRAAALLLDAETCLYFEVAHFIPWQAPDRFAADVSAWLDRREIA